jgi:hypothetical protein
LTTIKVLESLRMRFHCIDIVDDWENLPELAAAIAASGLSNWVAELKNANQLFEQKYLQGTAGFSLKYPV